MKYDPNINYYTHTTKEMAELLDYTPQYLTQLASHGMVRAIKRGRQWRFNPTDVEEDIYTANRRPVQAQSPLTKEEDVADDTRSPETDDLLL